jgi:transcriptional regulator with XRE-family HTH domain
MRGLLGRIEVNPAAITAIRSALGMSQTNCAARAGLTQGYLSKIENGDKPHMAPEAFDALCRVLRLRDRTAIMAIPSDLEERV